MVVSLRLGKRRTGDLPFKGTLSGRKRFSSLVGSPFSSSPTLLRFVGPGDVLVLNVHASFSGVESFSVAMSWTIFFPSSTNRHPRSATGVLPEPESAVVAARIPSFRRLVTCRCADAMLDVAAEWRRGLDMVTTGRVDSERDSFGDLPPLFFSVLRGGHSPPTLCFPP